MQDDRRSMSAPTAGPHGTQLKIAIPRLTSRRAPPPATAKSRQRDRVQRACRNCHKRKIKCSGTLPCCNHCEKTNKPCVYERPRKDRLALANDRNQALVSVLQELSQRVSDSDRQRIADALHDSDESTSPALASRHYQKHAHLHPLVPSPSHVPPNVETSPISDQPSMPRLDGIFPEDSSDDEASDSWDVVEAGYLGQVSEIQWLENLRSRVQVVETAFLKPTIVSAPMTYPVSPDLAQSLAFMAMDQTQSVPPATYHLDDEGVKFIVGGNPFELPPEQTADLLFRCFNRTVQNSFPMIPMKLEIQLRQYYNLMRTRQDVHCPEKWFALVNLVFAIGAKFSHLIQADWRADALDHITYVSRAYQLLNMNDAVFAFSTPDLPSTQAAGLFAIYYMSVGHFNRAWVMAGGAMRSAFSLGLHVQQEDHSISAARQQNKVDTWWSLHSLDSLLSSITGRPGTFPSEEITTPPSKAFSDILSTTHGQGASATTNMIFLNADSNLHLLTRQVMSSLYTQRKLTPTWSQVQQIMVTLVGDLDKWAMDCVPQFYSDIRSMNYEQQRENSLLKLQYYRVKILTTRPSLRRIERCAESRSIEFTNLDQSMAEACIQAASDVVSVLGTVPNIDALYEKGPWWTIVHNVTQALAVLMNAIACPDHFPSSISLSTYGVHQLVGWLRAMRGNNVMAARAHQVVYSIVKTSNPYIWAGVADAFPDDYTVILHPPAPVPARVDAKYVPWPANEQPVDSWFDYDLDTFFGFHYPLT